MWIIFHMWDKLEEFKGHTKHIFLRETATILVIIALWMVLLCCKQGDLMSRWEMASLIQSNASLPDVKNSGR